MVEDCDAVSDELRELMLGKRQENENLLQNLNKEPSPGFKTHEMHARFMTAMTLSHFKPLTLC